MMLKLCSGLHEIPQFHLPPTRFITPRAEQNLEYNVRNKLLNVATPYTDLGRMEAWIKLSARDWSWNSKLHD